jgi:N-acetylneuraminic acid mutarotase
MSKTIQVNNNTVYIIGGHQNEPSLLTRTYIVDTSCFRLNIDTGDLKVQNSMLMGRRWHAICSMEHYIYVVGGVGEVGQSTRLSSVSSTERFNINLNQWTKLP